MRLSCCAYSYRQALRGGTMALFDFLRLCREIGCDGAELTAYYFPTTARAYLNDLKRQAHREGVLISGTAMANDFTHPDAEKRAEQIARTKEWIAHSAALGAPTLRVVAGQVREGQNAAEACRNAVACLQECAECAWEEGVMLALENHEGLTVTAEAAIGIMQAVDRPGLRLNLDCGNFYGDFYAQIAAAAPHAAAAHAKPRAYHEYPESWEAVDYRRVRGLFAAAEYRGFLAIEYEEEEPPETGVPRFAAELRAAFGY